MLEGGAIALVTLALVLKAVPMATVQLLQANSMNISSVVLTLVGVAELALTGYETAQHELDGYLRAAGFLLPLTDTFAFLNLGVIRDSAAGPYCVGAKCFIDFVGCVAGGMLELVNGLNS